MVGYFITLYAMLCHAMLCYATLFCSVLFYSTLSSSNLFYSILFCSVIFYSVLFCSVGNLALSKDSYAQGVGFFDKVAIDYGYRIFSENNEGPLLQKLIDDAEAEGYVFLTDQVRVRVYFI